MQQLCAGIREGLWPSASSGHVLHSCQPCQWCRLRMCDIYKLTEPELQCAGRSRAECQVSQSEQGQETLFYYLWLYLVTVFF